MNFGSALEALKQGMQVTREEWGGMKLVMTPLEKEPFGRLDRIHYAGTIEGTAVSSADLLAQDWEVI